jgi:nicotinate phosphoribosyltransferase
MPNNCVFLVDTYDSLAGVRNAIEVGKELRLRGHRMIGIRLDSGDLAYLSIEARKMLDEAGFQDAGIVASNDLDEEIVESIKEQGGKVAVWGVGTHLVTSYGQPALGGVYKLSAIRAAPGQETASASAGSAAAAGSPPAGSPPAGSPPAGSPPAGGAPAGGAPAGGAPAGWQLKVKVSEQAVKATTPGVLQVRRYRHADGRFIADMIFDEGHLGIPAEGEAVEIVDPKEGVRRRKIAPGTAHEDLLVPIFRGGKRVYETPSLEASRSHAREQLAGLHPAIRRRLNPHEYPAGIERRLHDLKIEMLLEARRAAHRP